MARVSVLLGNPFRHDLRVQREVGSLVGAGHAVTVFATAAPGLPDREEGPGLTVIRSAEPAWVGWEGPRRLWPLLRWYSRFQFLADAARASAPDVVHSHDLELLLPAGRLAAALGVPHVHDDHELGLEKIAQWALPPGLAGPKRWAMRAAVPYMRWRGRALEERWIRRAAAVVTVSPLCGEVFRRRYGVDPVILRNLPSRTEGRPDPRLRERAGLPPAAGVVLFQGTITEACAPEVCIAAAADFPAGWALVFLGANWIRPRLEAQARTLGLTERVRFLDRVPPEELPGFTRAADIGLATVRLLNDAERYGLSNKLFEYLHAGLPVITTEGTAQAPIVREAEAGLVLPELTPAAVAAAVRTLAAWPAEAWARTRERLRARAREEWCWEVEERRLLDLYARLTRPPVTAGPSG